MIQKIDTWWLSHVHHLMAPHSSRFPSFLQKQTQRSIYYLLAHSQLLNHVTVTVHTRNGSPSSLVKENLDVHWCTFIQPIFRFRFHPLSKISFSTFCTVPFPINVIDFLACCYETNIIDYVKCNELYNSKGKNCNVALYVCVLPSSNFFTFIEQTQLFLLPTFLHKSNRENYARALLFNPNKNPFHAF